MEYDDYFDLGKNHPIKSDIFVRIRDLIAADSMRDPDYLLYPPQGPSKLSYLEDALAKIPDTHWFTMPPRARFGEYVCKAIENLDFSRYLAILSTCEDRYFASLVYTYQVYGYRWAGTLPHTGLRGQATAWFNLYRSLAALMPEFFAAVS